MIHFEMIHHQTRSSGMNESGELLLFERAVHHCSRVLHDSFAIHIYLRHVYIYPSETCRCTWMKNNFGFPARVEHRSPVKGVHSISTGYRLSVECNRPDSPCDIATTIRQSASVWSSAAALMKGLINSSRWPLIVIGRSSLIAYAQTNTELPGWDRTPILLVASRENFHSEEIETQCEQLYFRGLMRDSIKELNEVSVE